MIVEAEAYLNERIEDLRLQLLALLHSLSPLNRSFRFLAVTGIFLGWGIILAAIHYNPGFMVTRDALSELGRQRAHVPWVFRGGLVSLGAIITYLALVISIASRDRWETAAGLFMAQGGVFLVLLGLFPVESIYHVPIALMFFLEAIVATAILGLGHIMSGKTNSGAIFVGLSIVGPVVASFGHWFSIALLEAFGIVLLDLWIFTILLVHRPPIDEDGRRPTLHIHTHYI